MQLPKDVKANSRGLIGLQCHCVVDGEQRDAFIPYFSAKLYESATEQEVKELAQSNLRSELNCPQLIIEGFKAVRRFN